MWSGEPEGQNGEWGRVLEGGERVVRNEGRARAWASRQVTVYASRTITSASKLAGGWKYRLRAPMGKMGVDASES